MRKLNLFSRSPKETGALTARSIILPIVFCLVCGVLLILFGDQALRITAYVLAGVMLLFGIWSVIVYIRSAPARRITGSRLATGLILLVAGAMLAFNPDYPKDSMVYIWGLALLFGGFLKIQYAFDEKSVDVGKWWIMLILAAFSIILGVLALLNPAFLGESRNLVIGILLVFEAVLDIIVYFVLRHALKKRTEAGPPALQDAPAASVPAPEPEPVPVTPGDTVPETEA